MHVNARAIIERETPTGKEIVLQIRNKPHEGGKWLELPGGRVEEYESLVEALKRELCEETGLQVTHIAGLETKVIAHTRYTDVECLQPFAVYQTTRGPVDSMGVYFHCQAEGSLVESGDETQAPRWVEMTQVAAWMDENPEQFDWIDHAGLLFYLKNIPKGNSR
jgi:8-oxo-dGTP diphosphatase